MANIRGVPLFELGLASTITLGGACWAATENDHRERAPGAIITLFGLIVLGHLAYRMYHHNSLHYVTDTGVKKWVQLNIDGSIPWSQLPVNIRTLTFQSCPNLVDAHLDRLDLSGLQHLTLIGCPKLTGVGLDRFPLKSLGVSSCEAFDTLSVSDTLRKLALSYLPLLKDKSLAEIIKLTHLRTLEIGDCPSFSRKGLLTLAQAPELEYLNIIRCNIGSESGLHFSASNSLLTVHINNVRFVRPNTLGYLIRLHEEKFTSKHSF